MQRLAGKTAVVTGGGTGIGQAIVYSLSQEGAQVVLCGRRLKPIEASAAAARRAGGSAIAVQADVGLPEDVEKIVKAAVQEYGSIDILINNAAIYEGQSVHGLDINQWDTVMDVNLRGPFLLCRAVLPLMRARRSGHIINISSESGLSYYESEMPYGLSKHALNDLGEYIQRENQELNIRVNTICPGMVWTEMSENSPGLNREKCLFPEDIADLVLWLLTRRPNIKIGTPILIQTMENPWK